MQSDELIAYPNAYLKPKLELDKEDDPHPGSICCQNTGSQVPDRDYWQFAEFFPFFKEYPDSDLNPQVNLFF